VNDSPLYDVAVIGGGPAGMMAAGRAASLGKKVVLLEKNSGVGKKLLITGGGRCNVTNNEPDNKRILAKFKDAGKYLASPFSQWNVDNTLDFFHGRGMATVTQAEQRVFPSTQKAQTVWDTLVAYMHEYGVEVRGLSQVASIITSGESISHVVLKNGKEIYAKSFILATGGVSRPETGSTGDGFTWLKKIGHSVSDTTGALVPIVSSDAWVRRLAGVSMPHAKITAFLNGEKQESRTGKILFTHVGMSGPAILNFSSDIAELLKYGEVRLEIDALPDMGPEKVNETLQDLLRTESNKMIKNSLSSLIPSALVIPALELAGIDPDTFGHSVTRDARIALIKTLKGMPLSVDGLLGLDKAVITSGGLSLDDVDFKTMRSKKYSNLYIVGDLLDIDRPSGGYSLQLCWTTGFVAGTAAAQA
jgi:predicted Rossmann fold flavoprotein